MEISTASEIKALAALSCRKGQADKVFQKESRHAIRRLTQPERAVLEKILTQQKPNLKDDEVAHLANRLNLLMTSSDKTPKKHNCIVHTIQNFRERRLSSNSLIKKASHLTNADLDSAALTKVEGQRQQQRVRDLFVWD